MRYTVWIWPNVRAEGFEPQVVEEQEADDPLEAVFTVMRNRQLVAADVAQVFLGGDFVDEYFDFVCPDQEVC